MTMNLYIFKNYRHTEEFRVWLKENIGTRYRFTHLTRTLFDKNPSLIMKRVHEEKRWFHSQVKCSEGGWGNCPAARGHIEKKEFAKKRFFNSRFGYQMILEGDTDAVSVFFDDEKDMIFCKLRWQDYQK